MGWNDRYSSRQDFIEAYISELQAAYPSNILFDMVKFGGQIANTDSVFTNLGQTSTINLDLNTPSRTSFSFTTAGVTSSVGAVYEANSFSFTVTEEIAGSTVLVTMADGDANPWTDGTLIKLSGTGDVSIPYTSFEKIGKSGTFVAYGFKNMEEDHSYNIGEIVIDNDRLIDVSLKNWQTLVPGGGVELSIGAHGPSNDDSLDFVASSELVLRRPCTEDPILTTQISQTALRGAESVVVADTSIAAIGDTVDFVDRTCASLGHEVTNVSSTVLILFLAYHVT